MHVPEDAVATTPWLGPASSSRRVQPCAPQLVRGRGPARRSPPGALRQRAESNRYVETRCYEPGRTRQAEALGLNAPGAALSYKGPGMDPQAPQATAQPDVGAHEVALSDSVDHLRQRLEDAQRRRDAAFRRHVAPLDEEIKLPRAGGRRPGGRASNKAGPLRTTLLAAAGGLALAIVLWGGYSDHWPWTGID